MSTVQHTTQHSDTHTTRHSDTHHTQHPVQHKTSHLKQDVGSQSKIAFTDAKAPSILFIKGVFIEDCKQINSAFEDPSFASSTLMEKKTQIDLNDKIPAEFTTLSGWMQKTNLRCWYCDLYFGMVPIPIPKTVEAIVVNEQEVFSFKVEGICCSFPCAESFINGKYNKLTDNVEKRGMLRLIYKTMTAYDLDHIPEAFTKYSMRHYGGHLTIPQYEYMKRKIILSFVPRHLKDYYPPSTSIDKDTDADVFNKMYGNVLILDRELDKINKGSEINQPGMIEKIMKAQKIAGAFSPS